MSTKNQLQEYCQKNNTKLPVYETFPDHGLWGCELYFDGQYFHSADDTKKEAEKLAAGLALEYLSKKTSIVNEQVYFEGIEKEYKTILLVDGENCNYQCFEGVLTLVFMAKNSTRKMNGGCKMISESVGKDAVDHMITFYAGKFSVVHPEGKYYILTRDHFGQYLEGLMSNCKFICEMKDVK